jgi:hypothetical protein
MIVFDYRFICHAIIVLKSHILVPRHLYHVPSFMFVCQFVHHVNSIVDDDDDDDAVLVVVGLLYLRLRTTNKSLTATTLTAAPWFNHGAAILVVINVNVNAVVVVAVADAADLPS